MDERGVPVLRTPTAAEFLEAAKPSRPEGKFWRFDEERLCLMGFHRDGRDMGYDLDLETIPTSREAFRWIMHIASTKQGWGPGNVEELALWFLYFIDGGHPKIKIAGDLYGSGKKKGRS